MAKNLSQTWECTFKYNKWFLSTFRGNIWASGNSRTPPLRKKKTVTWLNTNSVTRCNFTSTFISTLLERPAIFRSSCPEVFCRKAFLKILQNSPEPEPLFNEASCGACNFINKETLAQMFSCEFCGVFKNAFFYRTPPVLASEFY